MTPLATLLGQTTELLLDFDGPVCRLFASYPAPAIAEHLREIIAAHDAAVPPPRPGDNGPLTVFRMTADLGDTQLTTRVASALRDAEVHAAESATPTPGAEEVMRAARSGGRRIAVVSNNSAEAVRVYLAAHDLTGYIDHLAARYDGMNPHLLKPHPYLVRAALDALGQPPAAAVFVGDSLDDIEAGRTVGVPTIGYANKPGKRQAMIDTGADAVIETTAELVEALSAAHRPS